MFKQQGTIEDPATGKFTDQVGLFASHMESKRTAFAIVSLVHSPDLNVYLPLGILCNGPLDNLDLIG